MKCKEHRYFHVSPLIAAFVIAGWLGWQPALAAGESKELQAVAQALGKSKLSLLAGIRQASQGSAKAISAKFEDTESGSLQGRTPCCEIRGTAHADVARPKEPYGNNRRGSQNAPRHCFLDHAWDQEPQARRGGAHRPER
ncbi:MAG: hypothetical protein E6H59_14155 [Betaproteobacteria bacterium]|nr:MAG: hypothetical protein E6H59_14155 [Betaproteobacteria bacterium]